MRLLLVIDNLASGGAQRQMTSLAIELKRRGHDAEIFVYHAADHFGQELRSAGVTIRVHPKPSRFSLAPVRDLRRLYAAEAYDAALSYMPVPTTYSLLAAIGVKSAPKLVISERTCAPSEWRPRQRLMELLYGRADHVTTNSYHMKDHLVRRRGWDNSHVTAIWNGLNLSFFQATPLARSRPDELKLLALGRVEPKKNWICLAEAIALVRERGGPRITVNLAGRLKASNRGEARCLVELRAALVRLGLDDSWHFLGERSDIVDLLGSHHALVHPSFAEGLPNVVCESLACGRPVIVSDTLDHPRLVEHGKRGFLFDHRSPESLANAICDLANLPPERLAEMGRDARAFAEEHLSVKRLADEYERLFRRLIGEPGQVSREPRPAR